VGAGAVLGEGSKNQRINARAETVDTTSAYRAAFKSRRCLIPPMGSIEWLKLEDGSKQPYRLGLADRRRFAFAGLWERNNSLNVTSCTIVTTEPNEVAGKIHNRMPVIMAPRTMTPGYRRTRPLMKPRRCYGHTRRHDCLSGFQGRRFT
jgi:putative SOS response-associated peptidase YedK